MAEKDTSRLLTFTGYGCSDGIAQWIEAAFFRWRKLGCAFKSPRGNLRFFSFIVFLPFGFLLFILTADPFSSARFLRKRISSLYGRGILKTCYSCNCVDEGDAF